MVEQRQQSEGNRGGNKSDKPVGERQREIWRRQMAYENLCDYDRATIEYLNKTAGLILKSIVILQFILNANRISN